MSIAADTSIAPSPTPQERFGTPPTPPPTLRKRSRFRTLILAAAALLAFGGLAATFFRPSLHTSPDDAILTYTVTPSSFDVKIKLSGELKALKNEEIRNQVEGMTTILWLIPEGARVKTGDVIVRLASDAIKDKVEDARIRVQNAEAAAVNARESVTIQQQQNDSDIRAAEINAETTRLEYEQFVNGDALVELATRQTTFENSQTDLKRKTDDLKRVKELESNGFVSHNDVLDAEIAYRDAVNKLDTAKMNLEVWNKYAEPKQRQTLQRKRDEGKAEFERVKRKAAANLLLKQAAARAQESTLRVESNRLASLETQLVACEIKAPQDGMVVYQSSVNPKDWWNPPIEEGLQVRQNQVLIQLPDTAQMLVEVRIAEQLTDRIQVGQNTTVTVDALPGQAFSGRVSSISVLPDSSNRQANLKEYPTQILLDAALPGMKPSMTAKAEIMVAHLDHVLAVPVQAVFAGGGSSYAYVGTADHYEKRLIKTGLSSGDQIEIREGLAAGDTVLLSRPKSAPPEEAAPATRPAPPKESPRAETAASAAPSDTPKGKSAG